MGGMMDIVMLLLILGGGYWLMKTGKLEEILTGAGLPGLPAPLGTGAKPTKPLQLPSFAPQAPAPSSDGGEAGGGGGGGGPAPAGGGGGPISSGGTCPGGENCQKDDQGRYDCSNVTASSYECTWCGSFSGDDLTIKMYGPEHHSDGDCCWCVVHVKESGEMVPGGEGPHPNSNCEHGGGKGAGKAQCYKGVMKPGPIQEGYALIGGKWQLMFSRKGPCGCAKTSNTKTGNQVTFRCDGNFQTTCATVRPLGGSSGGVSPAPSTGGGNEIPKAGSGGGGSSSGDGPGEIPKASNYVRRRQVVMAPYTTRV